MTGNDLVGLYEFSFALLKRNLKDLSNDESLTSPKPSGNCINWVLGHILTARNGILTLAGAGPLNGADMLARYGRGSEPLKDGEAPCDLATLIGLLEDSQQQILPALAALSDDALAAEIPEAIRRPPLTGTIGEGLARLAIHESYHSGQIGLLRRLVGKEGAIR